MPLTIKNLLKKEKNTEIKVWDLENTNENKNFSNLEEIVINDMFEMSFTRPNATKPILTTINAKPCIVLCARDSETGLTGLIHITIIDDKNIEKILILTLENFFAKFKNQNKENQKKINLKIHIYGGEFIEDLENFLNFINFHENNFEFELASCGLNLKTFSKDEILSKIQNFETEKEKSFSEKIKYFFNQKEQKLYNNSIDIDSYINDWIEYWKVKNFSIDSRNGNFLNYFTRETYQKIKDMLYYHYKNEKYRIAKPKIFFSPDEIKNQKLNPNKKISIEYLTKILFDCIYDPDGICGGVCVKFFHPELIKDFKKIQKDLNFKNPDFLDFSNLKSILNQIKIFEKNTKLSVKTDLGVHLITSFDLKTKEEFEKFQSLKLAISDPNWLEEVKKSLIDHQI